MRQNASPEVSLKDTHSILFRTFNTNHPKKYCELCAKDFSFEDVYVESKI